MVLLSYSLACDTDDGDVGGHHAPRPRGVRYMRGGGNTGSSDHGGHKSGGKKSHRSSCVRPSLTVVAPVSHPPPDHGVDGGSPPLAVRTGPGNGVGCKSTATAAAAAGAGAAPSSSSNGALRAQPPQRNLCSRSPRGSSSTLSNQNGGVSTPSAVPSPAAGGHTGSTPNSPLPTASGETNRSVSPATMTDVTQATMVLNRPSLTIFTQIDSLDEDAGGGALSTETGSPIPMAATAPSRSGSTHPDGPSMLDVDGERPLPTRSPSRRSSVLQQTVTSLSPEHHSYLFGNGLVPRSNSVGRVDGGSFAAAAYPSVLQDESGARSAALTPFATSVPMAQTAPRLSVTSVVPIVSVMEAEPRRRTAEEMATWFLNGGPVTAKAEQSKAAASAEQATTGESKSSSATVASPSGKGGKGEKDKGSKSGRSGSSSFASRLSKALKETSMEPAGMPLYVEPAVNFETKKPATPAPSAREQVIRVGIQRLYQRLSDLRLTVYKVKNDGNCQFRALSHQLLGSEHYHDVIRSHVVSYMRSVRESLFDFYFETPTHADEYFARLARLGSWGDELTLRGASDSLYINIHILSSEERNCYITYRPSPDAPPPPAFLVDVAKMRERKAAERRLQRHLRRRRCQRRLLSLQEGTAADTSSMAEVSSSLGALDAFNGDLSDFDDDDQSANTGGDAEGEDGDEREEGGEEELDANAIQRALQAKLTGARIHTATQCFVPVPAGAGNSLSANNSFARPSGGSPQMVGGVGIVPVLRTSGSPAGLPERRAATPLETSVSPASSLPSQPQPYHSRGGSGVTAAGGRPPLVQPALSSSVPANASTTSQTSQRTPLLRPGQTQEAATTTTTPPTRKGNRHADPAPTAASAAVTSQGGKPKTSTQPGATATTTTTTTMEGGRGTRLAKFTAVGAELTEVSNEDVDCELNLPRKTTVTAGSSTSRKATSATAVTGTSAQPKPASTSEPNPVAGTGGGNDSRLPSHRAPPQPTTSPAARPRPPGVTPLLCPQPTPLMATSCPAVVAPTALLPAMGTSVDDAYPVFPTTDGGNVILFATSVQSNSAAAAHAAVMNAGLEGARRSQRQSFSAYGMPFGGAVGGTGSVDMNYSLSLSLGRGGGGGAGAGNGSFGGPMLSASAEASLNSNSAHGGGRERSADPPNRLLHALGASLPADMYDDDDDLFNRRAAAPPPGSANRGTAAAAAAGASSALGTPAPENDICFFFEPRKEPIDVFLSYLYPVHYNSIVVQSDADRAAVAAGAAYPPSLCSTPATTTGAAAATARTTVTNVSMASAVTTASVPPTVGGGAGWNTGGSFACADGPLSASFQFVSAPFLRPQPPLQTRNEDNSCSI